MRPPTAPFVVLIYSAGSTTAACGDAAQTTTAGAAEASSSTGTPTPTPTSTPTSSATAEPPGSTTAPADTTSGAGGDGDGGDGSGGGGSTTDASRPSCGDGELQPREGEECDHGPDNDDNGPCKKDCKLAACGDGEVWSAGCGDACEECDNKGVCDDSCCDCKEVNALCTNGKLDGDEECDYGEETDPDDKAPCVGCKLGNVRRVFVTSQPHTGAIDGPGPGDALAEADLFCQERAAAAELPNATQFRAWLSRAQKDPEDLGNCPNKRFLRKEDVGWPYILVNGTDLHARAPAGSVAPRPPGPATRGRRALARAGGALALHRGRSPLRWARRLRAAWAGRAV